jgi:hypothetical protein
MAEPVEQRRMPPAQVGERVEHRRVRPGTLDRGGDALPDAPTGALSALADPVELR